MDRYEAYMLSKGPTEYVDCCWWDEKGECHHPLRSALDENKQCDMERCPIVTPELFSPYPYEKFNIDITNMVETLREKRITEKENNKNEKT